MSIKVAVYGSLRSGLSNSGLLVGQKFIKDDYVQGFDLLAYCSGYPAIVRSDFKETNTVTVEVYEVDEECFEQLDWLEGYPSFYNRTEVLTESGEKVWIYFMEENLTCEVIPHGDWKKYRVEVLKTDH